MPIGIYVSLAMDLVNRSNVNELLRVGQSESHRQALWSWLGLQVRKRPDMARFICYTLTEEGNHRTETRPHEKEASRP